MSGHHTPGSASATMNEKPSTEKVDRPVHSEKTGQPTYKEHSDYAGEEPHQRFSFDENINARLVNPLNGLSQERLMADGSAFANAHGLSHLEDEFRKGAVLAQNPMAFEHADYLSQQEKAVLQDEVTNKWKQPVTLYYLVIMCSVAAAVQGMDQAVINGANIFFAPQFGLNTTSNGSDEWIFGLINSAPYLCCAVLSCWLTDPMNNAFGRRGTIFITATISFIGCIWSAVTNTWWHLFIARFVLGIGIGPKSTTVPVYAAETTPAPIRGALVMMWQMWTAFGIMLGDLMDVAFLNVTDRSGIRGLNWRLMLGSAGIPALVVMSQVWLCPESPRWYIKKGRYAEAYKSLTRIRNSPLQAARDLYLIHVLLEAETEVIRGRNRILELFTVPRNRRAALASWIVMFMQQFCGVNAIAYYSTNIFTAAHFSQSSAFLASFGFGLINFLFAIPAIYTIDTFGRRNLLLTTFPLMAFSLLLTGFAFWIPEGTSRVAIVTLGIYLFGVVYSPGEGPVPFTYSAEAFPLYVRDIGMSFATATTWFFNFVLAITFPRLLAAFTPQGAFGWYAAWNMVGWVLILFLVPETKALSLEELDQVFSVPTRTHAGYQLRAIPHFIKRYVFRMKLPDREPLYHYDQNEQKTFAQAGGGH